MQRRALSTGFSSRKRLTPESETDELELAIALSLSLLPHDSLKNDHKRQKNRGPSLPSPPPCPQLPSAAAANAAVLPPAFPASFLSSCIEPELERCAICLLDDSDVDPEEMGGWGRTRCSCRQLYHFNCLSKWTNQHAEVQEYPFEAQGTALASHTVRVSTSYPCCRSSMLKTKSRMMERLC